HHSVAVAHPAADWTLMLPEVEQLRSRWHWRRIAVIAAIGIGLAVWPVAVMRWMSAPRYEVAVATARRPLVLVNGQMQQMPSGDFLAANPLVDTTGCSSTNVIQWNGSAFVCAVSSGGISGLTTNKIPRATSSTTLGDSHVSDDGTTISTTEPVSINATTNIF